MSVRIEDIRIAPEWGSGTTNFLLGNVGDKITIEVDFEVELFAIDNNDTQEIVAVPNTSTLTLQLDRLITSDTSIFSNFNVGDEILISGTASNNGTYAIVEILNNSNIIVDQDLATEQFPLNSFIALSTPINGVIYKYNFLENNAPETYISLIDGSEQALKLNDANAGDVVVRSMEFSGGLSYQVGSATCVGRGIVNGSQKFTITHETFITPLMLSQDFTDYLNGINPNYFNSSNCLGYVVEIMAGRNIYDLNTMQTSLGTQRLLGNTGWFDERFNGNPTDYSISNVSWNNTLQGIEIDEQVQLTFRINNTNSANFASPATRLVVGVFHTPQFQEEYVNDLDFRTNFLFDRSLNSLGQGSLSDITSGYSVISNVVSTLINSTTVEVLVTFNLGSQAQALLLAKNDPKYTIYATIKNQDLSQTTTDSVNLLVESKTFQIQLTESDLIDSEVGFYQHPETNLTQLNKITDFIAYPTDDVLARSDFSIDFTGREDDGIRIISIENEIVLQHTTEPEIILDDFLINTQNAQLNGLGQFFNFSQGRVRSLDGDNIRKPVRLNTNTPLGNVHSWTLYFPFNIGFDYWNALDINSLPVGLFDTNEPNNGLNDFWERLANTVDWSVLHRLRFTIEQNGELFSQTFDSPLVLTDYDTSDDWDNETIETFTEDESTPLNGAILGYDNTRVVATFEYVGSNAPTLSDLAVVIWIDGREAGSEETIKQSSSVYDIDNINPFLSIDSSNKVVVTDEGSNVFKGRILIDHEQLEDVENFTVYARIYDKREIPSGSGKMSGSVYLDSNGNDSKDNGEPVISGVIVVLYESDGTTFVAQSTTNVNGGYVFNNLPDGDYVLSIDTNQSSLSGYTIGTPNNVPNTVLNTASSTVNFGFDLGSGGKILESGQVKTTESGQVKTID